MGGSWRGLLGDEIGMRNTEKIAVLSRKVRVIDISFVEAGKGFKFRIIFPGICYCEDSLLSIVQYLFDSCSLSSRVLLRE